MQGGDGRAAGDPKVAPGPGERVVPKLRPIGRIETPFSQAKGTPIQSVYAQGVEGRVIVDQPFVEALDDIESFERIWLLYWMDAACAFRPKVVPYRDTEQRGLFATRAPSRPNSIGISPVRLLCREGGILHVADVDILDGTPLLDIKPYVPSFDSHPGSKAGWFDRCGPARELADERFHREPAFGDEQEDSIDRPRG
jgi:tRNA (adenine37-N6)-methyltransferase